MKTIHTPWGQSQSQRPHASGIVFHSTASHGGYHLSNERYAEFCEVAEFANFPQWLEEDCDAVLVYLRWPELATDEQVNSAVTMARHAKSWTPTWTAINAWLDRPSQSHILERAQKHADAVKHLWERRSLWTSGIPGIWEVQFRRGEQNKTVMMAYPGKRYYTDSELEKANCVRMVAE